MAKLVIKKKRRYRRTGKYAKNQSAVAETHPKNWVNPAFVAGIKVGLALARES